MKKKLIIALVAIATIAGAAEGYAQFKCQFCNGTGWRGSFACPYCHGTGRQ